MALPGIAATAKPRPLRCASLALLSLLALVSAGAARAHAEATPGSWWLWPALLASAALYGFGVRQLWRASSGRRGIRLTDVGAFALGWLALAAALADPLDALGQVSFAAHMAQHEILMLVAAPLLVLGKPLVALVWVFPPTRRQRIVRPLRGRRWRAAWGWLVSAPVAWSVHALTLWVWHAPAWFEAGLHHAAIHDLQHASFFASALLFWWALVRRRPGGVAVLVVLTTLLHTGFLGALLTFAPGVWYPSYVNADNPWGMTALADQQLGGLIMWVPAGAIFIGAGVMLLAQWLRALERAPQRAWLARDETP